MGLTRNATLIQQFLWQSACTILKKFHFSSEVNLLTSTLISGFSIGTLLCFQLFRVGLGEAF